MIKTLHRIAAFCLFLGCSAANSSGAEFFAVTGLGGGQTIFLSTNHCSVKAKGIEGQLLSRFEVEASVNKEFQSWYHGQTIVSGLGRVDTCWTPVKAETRRGVLVCATRGDRLGEPCLVRPEDAFREIN